MAALGDPTVQCRGVDGCDCFGTNMTAFDSMIGLLESGLMDTGGTCHARVRAGDGVLSALILCQLKVEDPCSYLQEYKLCLLVATHVLVCVLPLAGDV